MNLDRHELPHVVVGSCMEVHRHLGPGLEASAYRACLIHELRMREIVFEVDRPLLINYKGHELASAAMLELVVEGQILVVVKSVDELKPIHKDQMMNHLRLSGMETGFLVNFNVPHLRSKGLKRIIVSSSAPSLPYQMSEDRRAAAPPNKPAREVRGT
ncbi:hypothetical protein BH23VER1_BH23VER1_14400 [soil metagenome]